jgi:hypothetical protein
LKFRAILAFFSIECLLDGKIEAAQIADLDEFIQEFGCIKTGYFEVPAGFGL